MSLKNQTIIVFGANGFIGQEFIKINKRNILSPSSSEVNLLDKEGLKKYLLSNCTTETTVVILASITSYSSHARDAKDVMFDNIIMAENIVFALDRIKIRSLIYLSTIDVYGYPNEIITESTLPNPKTNYAISKKVSEDVLSFFCSNKEIPFLCLRLSQVYGVGDNSPKVIPTFIKKALNQKPIIINGKGEDRRDFISVTDVAKLIHHFVNKTISDTINIVSGKSTTIKELAEIIKKISNNELTITYSRSKNNKGSLNFDNEKLISYLPHFQFQDLFLSLEKIINTYEYH